MDDQSSPVRSYVLGRFFSRPEGVIRPTDSESHFSLPVDFLLNIRSAVSHESCQPRFHLVDLFNLPGQLLIGLRERFVLGLDRSQPKQNMHCIWPCRCTFRRTNSCSFSCALRSAMVLGIHPRGCRPTTKISIFECTHIKLD